MAELYIGLMSGTSIDSVDAGVFDLTSNCQQIASHSHCIPESIRSEILALCSGTAEHEIDRLGVLDKQLGELFSDACLELLSQNQIEPSRIRAIGSHGQTIRHRPDQNSSFTLQIGDANIIAEKTGIDTVADFRRRDMALGGQGAPLVPAFHQSQFASQQTNRAIINIGGMANVTLLTRDNQPLGFDTGPGNVLMDAWIQAKQNKAYDHNGVWAASGEYNTYLLEQLLSEPFFTATGPKSTGRELFNLPWLTQQVATLKTSDENVMATLLELTAQSIWQAIEDKQVEEIYLCGGGAENSSLRQRLATISGLGVETTERLGLNPNWVEAAAFAWLAKRFINRQPGNLPSATGAQRACVLGCLYPGLS